MNKLHFLVILLYNLYDPSLQSPLFKSEMKVNPLTRGYEGLTVVIDKHFNSEDCIKIIKDIKVFIIVLRRPVSIFIISRLLLPVQVPPSIPLYQAKY